MKNELIAKEKVYVIGAGPGAAEYLLPIATERAAECDLLIGSERALELFAALSVEKTALRGSFDCYQEQFQRTVGEILGIVVAGDPGFYSLLAFLRRNYSFDNIEVIPGISSYQYLFARLGIPWQNYHLTSCHGREIDDLQKLLQRYGRLSLLTDFRMNPSWICRQLVDSVYSSYRVVVGENLSYPEERIISGTVEEIAEMEGFEMSVVIIDEG